MGMTDEQFWRSTPTQFTLRVEAYKRHNRADAMYFRETFALLYNINRSEKAPVMDGKDILILHGEKPPKKERRQKSMMDDPVAFADYMERINAMARRERDESALFGLTDQDYMKRRAAGEITAEMVEYLMRERYFKENPDAAADSFVMPIITNPQSMGAEPPARLASLGAIRAKVEAERELGAKSIPAPVTPIEVANSAPVPVGESKPEMEPETRAETNLFVPPGLSGEATPIQPTQWD